VSDRRWTLRLATLSGVMTATGPEVGGPTEVVSAEDYDRLLEAAYAAWMAWHHLIDALPMDVVESVEATLDEADGPIAYGLKAVLVKAGRTPD
jgi:hypothetical protein